MNDAGEGVVSGPANAAERPTEQHIRFVDEAAKDDVVLMWFADPVRRVAVLRPGAAGSFADEIPDDALEVMLLTQAQAGSAPPAFAEWLAKLTDPEEAPPVYVKVRGVELAWRPGRMVLQCGADQADVLLPALAEFAHYEGELRRIEEEISSAWAGVEEDKGLAFDVTPADLRRSAAVGERMAQALERRIRLQRMEVRLWEPDPRLTAAGQRLGEELREKAQIETRVEILDGQIQVFEHIYEMSAQRMGEYRAARESSILEWVIVLLLAAEVVVMLWLGLRGAGG